jgi:hypothetical protein
LTFFERFYEVNEFYPYAIVNKCNLKERLIDDDFLYDFDGSLVSKCEQYFGIFQGRTEFAELND